MPEISQPQDKFAGAFDALPDPAAIICGMSPAVLNPAAKSLLGGGGAAWLMRLPGLSAAISRREELAIGAALPSGALCVVQIHPIAGGGVLILIKPGELTEREPSESASHPENYPWKSAAMATVLERIHRLSLVGSSVLLAGEKGVCKERFARTIHRRSLRSNRPFLVVDCRRSGDPGFEDALFGSSEIRGTLERAQDGVVFVDEICDLPRSAQDKLLQIMAGKKLTSPDLGDVTFKARIIAASTLDLRHLTANDEFSEELYLRFAPVAVEITPLRQRTEDIIPLANFFVSGGNPSPDNQPVTISDDAAAALMTHSWPMNERELESVIRGALETAQNGQIEPHDLSIIKTAGSSLSNQINSFQRDRIKAMLDIHGHTLAGKRAAAKALGIGVSTLYRLLASEKNRR